MHQVTSNTQREKYAQKIKNMYLMHLHIPAHTAVVMYNLTIQKIQSGHWGITLLSKKRTLNTKISALVMKMHIKCWIQRFSLIWKFSLGCAIADTKTVY